MKDYRFYNPCQTCKNKEIVLVDDTTNKLSKVGGIRAVCTSCGRNTEPTVWNQYNKEEEAV